MIKIHLVLLRTRQLGSKLVPLLAAPAVVGCRASSLTEVVFHCLGCWLATGSLGGRMGKKRGRECTGNGKIRIAFKVHRTTELADRKLTVSGLTGPISAVPKWFLSFSS